MMLTEKVNIIVFYVHDQGTGGQNTVVKQAMLLIDSVTDATRQYC